MSSSVSTPSRSTITTARSRASAASWASRWTRLVFPYRRGACRRMNRPWAARSRRVPSSSSRPMTSSGGRGPSKMNGDVNMVLKTSTFEVLLKSTSKGSATFEGGGTALAEGGQALAQVLARPRGGERGGDVGGVGQVGVEGVEHQLVAGDGERGPAGDLVGPLQRLVGRAEPLDQAEAVSLVAGQHLRGEEHRPGRSLTGHRAQPLHGPVVDHQAELGGGDAELGGGRRGAQVAGDRQLRAGPEGGTLHRGDGRVGRAPQGGEHRSQPGGEAGVLDPREVGARAEVATLAPDDEDPGGRRRLGHLGSDRLEGRIVE